MFPESIPTVGGGTFNLAAFWVNIMARVSVKIDQMERRVSRKVLESTTYFLEQMYNIGAQVQVAMGSLGSHSTRLDRLEARIDALERGQSRSHTRWSGGWCESASWSEWR